QQYRVRFLRGLTRRTGPRVAFCIPRELLELVLAAGIAEHHLMPGSRKDRSELAAHQPRTEHADSHRSLLRGQSRGACPEHWVSALEPTGRWGAIRSGGGWAELRRVPASWS